MSENFPNLKEIDTKIQEAQRALNKWNPNRSAPRHTIIKRAKVKDKERILKAIREKLSINYKGNPIKQSDDLSTETQKARREWQDIFIVQDIFKSQIDNLTHHLNELEKEE